MMQYDGQMRASVGEIGRYKNRKDLGTGGMDVTCVLNKLTHGSINHCLLRYNRYNPLSL